MKARTLLPLLALGAMSFAVPAGAQALPFGSAVAAPYSTSKTQAILGGASRLAAILAAQGSTPEPAPAALIPSPAGTGLVHHTTSQSIVSPIRDGRPDVFKSVALPVRSTPLDSRWNSVRDHSADAKALAYVESIADLSTLEKLDAVNRYVNRHVAYVADEANGGGDDHWSSGAETLSAGKGDCEDFAIAKLELLRAAGFAADDLYLVIVRNEVRNIDHAVLVVHAEDRLLVLDNGTDLISDSAVIDNYRPILSFSAQGTWTHGYSVNRPAFNVASSAIAPDRSAQISQAAPAPSAAN